MSRLKKAVHERIWKSLCPEWFIDKNNEALQPQVAELESLIPLPSDSLELHFQMTFSDDSKHEVRLNEQSVYRSFYSNKCSYEIAQYPTCTLLDIALAKGGPEVIVEVFTAL